MDYIFCFLRRRSPFKNSQVMKFLDEDTNLVIYCHKKDGRNVFVDRV